jgi:hypothetical protein
MSITVRYRALSSKRKIELFKKKDIRDPIKKFMDRFLNEVMEIVRAYPPARADSTYQRTFRLFESWDVDVRDVASALVGYITTDAVDPRGRHYSTYVHGDWQVDYHAETGWKKLYEYLQRPKFRKELMVGLQEVLNNNVEK